MMSDSLFIDMIIPEDVRWLLSDHSKEIYDLEKENQELRKKIESMEKNNEIKN